MNFLLSTALKPTTPYFVAKKLEQVIALLMINSYPTVDFCEQFLKSPVGAIQLGVLSEAAYILKRLPELTKKQYDFKFRLSDAYTKVLQIIAENLHACMNVSICLDLFLNFCAFKYFPPKAANVALRIIELIADESFGVAASEALVCWFESDLKELPLDPFILTFLQKSESMISVKDPELLRGICQTLRAFGILVVDLLYAKLDSTFMDIHMQLFWNLMAKVTRHEYCILQSPELLYFWQFLIERIYHNCDQSKNAWRLVYDVAENLIAGLTAVEQITDERSIYISEAKTVLTLIYSVIKEDLVEILLKSHESAPEACALCFIQIAPCKNDRISISLLQTLLPLCGKKVSLQMISELSKLIEQDPELSRQCKVYSLQYISDKEYGFLAYKFLKSVMDSSLASEILSFSSHLPQLEGKAQLLFWKLFCQSISLLGNVPYLLSDAMDFLQAKSNDKEFPLMLDTFLKKIPYEAITVDDRLWQKLSSLLATATDFVRIQQQLVPINGSLSDFVDLWCTIVAINRDESKAWEQVRSLLQSIIEAQATHCYSVWEAAITLLPLQKDHLSMALLARLNSANDDEEVSSLLPLLNRAARGTTLDPSSYCSLIDQLTKRLGSDISDDLLCSIVKFLEILRLTENQMPVVLERLLISCKNILVPQQVEIAAPIVLKLAQYCPKTFFDTIKQLTVSSELIKKLCACRTPRLLGNLLNKL